jgi:pyruvate dehydrogenase complex dehydrogenase (E1) component
MKSPGETLDSLLPLLRAEKREIHVNATIVEVAAMSQLIELAADPKVRRYFLGRLSDTAALVEPGRDRELEAALIAAGHTPKLLDGAQS